MAQLAPEAKARDKLGLERCTSRQSAGKAPSADPTFKSFTARWRVSKGVFITTSTFSAQALEFAKSVERIVLIDGVRLAELMIEHEVGVTLRLVKVRSLITIISKVSS